MATESPIIIMDTSGKWPTHKAVEELGLLLKGQRLLGNGRDVAPNRSESAPPSIEGSFAAIENLITQQNSSLNGGMVSVNSAIDSYEPEQFRANPDYLAYYRSNVNLNNRLPPPLISLENRRLVRHIGTIGNNWRLTSFDDCGNGSLHLSQSNLPTHEEESEDDRSPQQAPDYWANRSCGFWSGHKAALSGQHKSLVDLLQEDDPCTTSPVYTQSHSLSHESVEEVDYDADSSSLHSSSVSTSNATTSTPGADNMGPSSTTDPPAAPVSSSSSLDSMGVMPAMPPLHGRHSNAIDVHLEDEVLISGVSDSDVIRIESEVKAINISRRQNSKNHKDRTDRQHSRHMLQQQTRHQQSHTFEFQGAKSQVISQGMNHTYIGMNQILHGPSNFSSAEVQPLLESSGFTPPLYATAAAYMTSSNPFYSNLQPSGYFSPQYGVGGYALNATALPPFVAGYSPHSAIPVAFDGAAGPSFGARNSEVSTGGVTAHGVDMQHLNKFYGQFGFSLPPSFNDPLHMQYFQPPFGDAYSVSGQLSPFAPRDAAIGNQVSALDLQRGADLAACSADQKLQHQGSGNLSTLNPRRGGIISPYYFGNPTNTGILMQFATSPVASPVLPGSPVGGTGFPGGRNEVRFPASSGRNGGIYSGWQGQRGFESLNDAKTYSFLEELRSGKGRRFELIDIAGHIVEFSADQHGSRFIQQKLENCSVEEKASVFQEVLPHALKLVTDVFGNYIIQKFFEYGSPEQRKELANQLEGQILPLSLQMYGCRVIQKALEVIELEQKTKLVHELDGHVMRCVRDQNGNHVIQKCIESIPTDNIGFIISSFCGQVATFSMHPYGCRVIQRVLEHCTDELQSQFIVDEIIESVCTLAQDQYGNYVTQHVLERGKPYERSQIINKLSGHIVQMSQHKFASNVVEKCLEYGDSAAREILIGEIIGHNDGNDNLLTMMKDQYANYVIQKILETCADNQREMLLSRISIHLNALKKYTYGKHIVAQFEHLYGEEIQTSGP